MKENYNRNLNIRVHDKLYKECSKIALSYGIPLSTFLRHVIVQAVEKVKKNKDKEKELKCLQN